MKPNFGRGLTLMWSQLEDGMQKFSHACIQFNDSEIIEDLWAGATCDVMSSGKVLFIHLEPDFHFSPEAGLRANILCVHIPLLGHIYVASCTVIFLSMPVPIRLWTPQMPGRTHIYFWYPRAKHSLMVYSNRKASMEWGEETTEGRINRKKVPNREWKDKMKRWHINVFFSANIWLNHLKVWSTPDLSIHLQG